MKYGIWNNFMDVWVVDADTLKPILFDSIEDAENALWEWYGYEVKEYHATTY